MESSFIVENNRFLNPMHDFVANEIGNFASMSDIWAIS